MQFNDQNLTIKVILTILSVFYLLYMKLTSQRQASVEHLKCSRQTENNKRSDPKEQKDKQYAINIMAADQNNIVGQQKSTSKNLLMKFDQTQKTVEKSSNNKTEILTFSNEIRKIVIQKYDDVSKETVPCIMRIMANVKITAAFDNENNLWLLGMIFPQPINLSNVIRKKIIDGYLGQRGIVIKTIHKFYVINWDKIEIPKEKLKKIEISRKYSGFIQCWEEAAPYRPDAWYFFTSKKQCAWETIYYHVFAEKLIIYPFEQQITIGQKIQGISASKTHSLCWTESGKIFSWGQQTLALGYNDFEDKIKSRQIQRVKFEVATAVAGTHYSIALSSDGELYEWGIKNIFDAKSNKFTEEFIFAPKKLQIGLNSENQKICCLKGFEDSFGVLTFKNNFFVWGKKIPRKTIEFNGVYNEEQNHELFSQNSMETKINLNFPTYCKCSQTVKIIDFQLRQNSVILVTAPLLSNLKNLQCQKFWARRIKNISGVIKKYKAPINDEKKHQIVSSQDINSQDEQQPTFKKIESRNQIIHRRYQSAAEVETNPPENRFCQMQKMIRKLNNKKLSYEDKITKVANQRLTKQEFFKKLKNEQKLFQNIMQGEKNKSSQRNSIISTEHYMTPKNESINLIKFQRKNKLKTFDARYSEGDEKSISKTTFRSKIETVKSTSNLHQLNINPFQALMLKFDPIELQKKKRNDFYEKIKKTKKQFISTGNSRQTSPNSKNSSTLYKLKLKKVLSKKQTLHEDFFKSTLDRMQRNSIQFKKKNLEMSTLRKQRQEAQQLVKNTLFEYLIKSYLVKCLTNSIPFGRETKIKVFVSNLKYNRIQKSVRRLFYTKRVKFEVKTLKQHFPRAYLKLLIIYRNYVRLWRESRLKNLKKYCAQEVLMINCRNKLKTGVNRLKFSVKILQNIGSWLQISKHEKIKCLSQLWKTHLLTMFPVKSEYQRQYSKKTEPLRTFKQVYVERMMNNPMLKIENYLGASPLFKMKMLKKVSQRRREMGIKDEQTLKIVFLKQNPIHKSEHVKKEEQEQNNPNENQEEILENLSEIEYLLPYSTHANIFQKPLNLELSGNVRNGQKWVEYEKRVLIEKFKSFIRKFHLQCQRKTAKYRRQMAGFIRDNYSKISQRRYKYILEYNQLQSKKNERQIKIKERQLIKLLSMIGCENILNNDILPQKHRILDEAREIHGAPQPPSIWITFGINEFRKIFKEYFETLQQKVNTKKVLHFNSRK